MLDGLFINTEKSNVIPMIYLNSYFEQVQQGAKMEEVLSQIADTYQARYINHDMDMSAVMDFDSMKDKIICKLIKEEANQELLQDKPYTKVEDLSAVYQILVDKMLRVLQP